MRNALSVLNATDSTNPFATDSAIYARVRPRYPESLYAWIASQSVAHQVAWDCATGNGQAAIGLSAYFGRVEATDVSEEQIAHAVLRPNVYYSVRPAESSGFADESFDLITVAQALHWFDFQSFWTEVSRVARPGAFFCAWGYDWLTSCPLVNDQFVTPVRKILEPFWAPKIQVLLRGYIDEDIAFPYLRSKPPEFAIEEHWTLSQLIQYLETLSAFKRSRTDDTATRNLSEVVHRIQSLIKLEEVLPIRMPLCVVAGTVNTIGA